MGLLCMHQTMHRLTYYDCRSKFTSSMYYDRQSMSRERDEKIGSSWFGFGRTYSVCGFYMIISQDNMI